MTTWIPPYANRPSIQSFRILFIPSSVSGLSCFFCSGKFFDIEISQSNLKCIIFNQKKRLNYPPPMGAAGCYQPAATPRRNIVPSIPTSATNSTNCLIILLLPLPLLLCCRILETYLPSMSQMAHT